MSRYRLALSVLLTWHVAALGIAAVPSPVVNPLPPVALSRHIVDDRIAAVLAPALDAALEIFAPVPRTIARVTRPVRTVVDVYLDAFHLPQSWNMFSNPPTVDQYMRVRYYVGPEQVSGMPSRPTWVATELVLPANREDQVRTFQSFRDSSRDKALSIALDDFDRAFDRIVDRTGKVPQDLPDDLAPIGRYFSRKFEHDRLAADEHVVRTEVWYGVARNPARGIALEPSVVEARLAVLRAYYMGPLRASVPASTHLGYGSIDKEVDITWMLKYFEEQ
jgi:hypothetical protein